MTMPVETTAGTADRDGAMSFVLPRANAAAPPSPKTDDVRIEQVDARLVAVRAFGGIVTDEEVPQPLSPDRALLTRPVHPSPVILFTLALATPHPSLPPLACPLPPPPHVPRTTRAQRAPLHLRLPHPRVPADA